MRADALLAPAAFTLGNQQDASVIPSTFVPSGTRCVELHSPTLSLNKYYLLPPEEQALVRHAADRRKADFGDSRWCAHQAMSQLSYDQPILRGERGMPLFPAGLIGSLTHTEGFRAALVGRSSRWRSLGIDAEPAQWLPEGVFHAVASPEERRRINALAQQEGIEHLDKVLFSAKEATYKAWFPLARRFLDFHQAEVDIRPDGTFISYLLVRPVPMPFIEGRWIIRKGYVVTIAGVR